MKGLSGHRHAEISTLAYRSVSGTETIRGSPGGQCSQWGESGKFGESGEFCNMRD
jgi:hypothetical protein